MTRPGFTHGTRYGYEQKRCRCESCRAWNRDYRAGLMARHLAADPDCRCARHAGRAAA